MTYLDETLKNEIVQAWREVGLDQRDTGSFAEPAQAFARAQFLREIVQALDDETATTSYSDAEHEHVGELADVVVEHAGLLAAQAEGLTPIRSVA